MQFLDSPGFIGLSPDIFRTVTGRGPNPERIQRATWEPMQRCTGFFIVVSLASNKPVPYIADGHTKRECGSDATEVGLGVCFPLES